jgi:hypothetical protein
MSNLKHVVALVSVMALATSGLAVADPLTAGKPAGVKQAQMESVPPLVWIAVAGILAAGIAAATATGNSQSTFTTVSATTTG